MLKNQSIYLSLLKEWGDTLLKLQINNSQPTYGVFSDGGIICPACKHIHGRCPDAVYGLMCLAHNTGEEKYLGAARKLFAWHENLICDDNSVYNDANSEWNGITTFSFMSLHEALVNYGELLSKEEKKQWEARMLSMGKWVAETIVLGYETNINYLAASATIQALLSKYFNLFEYEEKAKELASYVMKNFTENGLLCGEGIPHDFVTERGCRPIDIGYNVEETVPLLIRYALAMKDNEMLDKLTAILQKQLEFMLPDGGWDNSFGTRNNKWTYWGSRTSDGCQASYALLAERDSAFAEAAMRNLELMKRCTNNGLLYGGVEYQKYGEPPCVHHTFTHINSIAAAIDAGIEKYTSRISLPIDENNQAVSYFPEIDTYKLTVGDWRSTVTGYDCFIEKGHATGGTMTMLWHKSCGVVLISSVVDYKMVEPLNMQLSLNKKRHRPLTPRFELVSENIQFTSAYDKKAIIRVEEALTGININVKAALVSLNQNKPKEPVSCDINYQLTKEKLVIDTTICGNCDKVRLILPVVADNAEITSTNEFEKPEQIFFLTGGFGAREFIFKPDNDNKIHVEIKL